MATFFNEFLYRPLLNLLIWLYQVIPGGDLGLSIVVLTILIRVLLLPFTHKALCSQRELQRIQPELFKIQKKYKGNREKQAQEIMKLYQSRGVNPLGGCLPMLIQLPILIALFRVFINLKDTALNGLYSFVPNPGTINSSFLGLVDLSQPHFGLAFLAGLFQYFQSRLAFSKKGSAALMQSQKGLSQVMTTQMIYFMPVLTVLIAMRLPAALALYWAASTLFAVGQELYLHKFITEKPQEKADSRKKT